MIPLDRNESYWLLDDELLNACKQYDSSALSMYPRYEELKQKIASYAEVPIDHIALTPGSDAAIQEIARLYVGNGRRALLPVPTFYGYELVLARVGANIIPVFYTEKDGRFEFPIEETCSILESERPEALFLCNPNNPLGCLIPDEMIERMVQLAAKTGTMLILDEAYYEYSGRTLAGRIAQNPPLIILRTFSKGFGIPGARIGYVIAVPEVISKIEKLLLPWPIAHLSSFVASTLLDNKDAVAVRRELVIKEREIFSAELRDRIEQSTIYPSETNFVFLRMDDAQEIANRLKGQGIAVATCDWMSNFSEAKSLLQLALRIAIPSPADRRRVIDSLANS